MWLGRQCAEWDKFSLLAALIHNQWTKKTKLPDDFNPFAVKKGKKRKEGAMRIENIHQWKAYVKKFTER